MQYIQNCLKLFLLNPVACNGLQNLWPADLQGLGHRVQHLTECDIHTQQTYFHSIPHTVRTCVYMCLCVPMYLSIYLLGQSSKGSYMLELNTDLPGLWYPHQDKSRAIAFLHNAWAGRAGTLRVWSWVHLRISDWARCREVSIDRKREGERYMDRNKNIFIAEDTCFDSIPSYEIIFLIYIEGSIGATSSNLRRMLQTHDYFRSRFGWQLLSCDFSVSTQADC